jgi:hypothetical protein
LSGESFVKRAMIAWPCRIHFEVTQNPAQVWLSQQMTDAFPWDTAPRYLLRERDASYGPAIRDRVRVLASKRLLPRRGHPGRIPTSSASIGSIRRECLDHIVILNEHHLRGVLSKYFQYHHDTKTHLSLSAASSHTTSLCRQDYCVPGGRWSASSR